MKVRGLVFDPHTNMYIVILNDEENKEVLPIWIGKFEANAICFILEGIKCNMFHIRRHTPAETHDT